MSAQHVQRSGIAVIIARILGGVILVFGLLLALGGGWLLSLSGSAYYLIAGLGWLVAGWLIFTARASGGYLYAAVFFSTVIWAFYEADGSAWALVPRLIVPAVFMAAVALLMPYLKKTAVGNRGAWIFVVLLIVAGISVPVFYAGTAYIPSDTTSIPGQRQIMSDPSPLRTGSDWPAYGGSYAARRYSPLQQINKGNVRGLERTWVFETGDMPPGDPSDSSYGAETTPLKVGDSLYLCTAMNILIAIDAQTGIERWRHDPGVAEQYIPYTAACRGVAYFESPAQTGGNCGKRIIEGTLDGRLIAVDAASGQRCEGFGENGSASITVGMGQVEPGMVAMTSPPTIIQGVIVTGHQVKDGISIDAPSGVLQGFDAVTGEHLWAWDMDRPELSGRPTDGAPFTRGTPNMWTTASGDEALGYVYAPMGNSAGDYLSADRSGAEDTYSTALVALDVNTGKPVWHFRTVDIDVWDYDLGSQASLVDFPAGGGTVPALILPTKQGDIYVLDRRTGKPLTGVERRRVPAGGVEPEERTPTQPFSAYHTLAKPALEERDMWGMSPLDQMICRIQYRRAAYAGIYTPPTSERHWIQYPGYNGGSDWGGVAIDASRGIIVANYNDMPNYNRLAPQAGAPYAIDVNAGWRMPFTDLLCKEPPYGGIRAIDLVSGATLWDRPFGTARRNGPFGIPSMLPAVIGTPNNGGPVVTAGGLIFIAAATDNLIKAIDIETGETLWQDKLSAGGQATPMTYEYNGRQYVVIMAGGHHFMHTPIGDDLIAYALPGD